MEQNKELEEAVSCANYYFWKLTPVLFRTLSIIAKKLQTVKEAKAQSLKKFHSSILIKSFMSKYFKKSKESFFAKSVKLFGCFTKMKYHILVQKNQLSSTKLFQGLIKEMSPAYYVLRKTNFFSEASQKIFTSLKRFSAMKQEFKKTAKKLLDATISRVIIWDELHNPPGTLSNSAIQYYQNEKAILNGLFEHCYLNFLKFRTKNFRNISFERTEIAVAEQNKMLFEVIKKIQICNPQFDEVWANFQNFDRTTSARRSFFLTSDQKSTIYKFHVQTNEMDFKYDLNAKETFSLVYFFLTL